MSKKHEIMNIKQFLKLISILAFLISTIGLFVFSVVDYGLIDKSYPKMIEMVNFNNVFSFGHLLSIILTLFGLAISIISIYLDKNKVIPLVLFIISLVACILVFLSARMGAAYDNTDKFSLHGGAIFIGVLLAISTIACGINSFRIWIMKKDN